MGHCPWVLDNDFRETGAITKDAHWAASDRQFWLCPLVAQNRVYVGNWSRHPSVTTGEIQVKSFAKRIDGGYALEALIPAAELGNWNPKKGAEMALGFTLAVKGLRQDREIFWPASKLDKVIPRPWM